MTERGPARPLLVAGVAFVLVSFALNSAITRWIVSGGRLDPGLTTMVRFLAGAVVLAVLVAVRGDRGALVPGRGNLVPVFWLAAYAFLISYGYQHIGAAAGTFVFYALVLLTMTIGGAVIGRKLPAPRAALGGAVALVGLGFLTFARVEQVTLLGIVLLAGTGASWGAYSLLGKRRSDPLRFTTENFVLLGVLLVVPTVLLWSGAFGPVAVTGPGFAAAALMGSLTTALSYAVWYWALQRLDAAQAGTYQLAIPVLTALLGVGWLGEMLTWRLAVAGVLILMGMGMATPRWTKRRRKKEGKKERLEGPDGS